MQIVTGDILKDQGPGRADVDLFKHNFETVFDAYDVLCFRLDAGMLSHGCVWLH